MMAAWSPVARLGWLTLVTRGWSVRNSATAVAVVLVALGAALDHVEQVRGGVEGERGVPVQRRLDGALGVPDVSGVHAAGGQPGARLLGRGVRLDHESPASR
jgi:hypothetical protein